ncbi:nuclear transport factor 2 family protein [Salegentibacter sp. LM13S]|uniref:nuclear transport factor 2 family protein n=1 Tax=Salegentibacter lacus TaxID=2873599 RepID=UPI001CCB9743|nr:nuclear transport factor 2 family protein [Salegentibacter lacus]MBZ9631276.1 nuclear transport factor 2 family protein [Salegentibacter lacus]
MNSRKINYSIVIVLFVSIFSFQTNAQSAAVEQLHQLYIKTINTGDLGNLNTLYADDVSIRNSDGSMVAGLKNVKEQYKATFDNGDYNITLKTIEEQAMNEDHMFASGSFVFTKIDEPQMVQKGTFVNTLKNVNGHWKIYKSYRYPETNNNSSIIDGLYKAFAAGDIPTVLAGMDPEIVWNEAEGNAYADGNPYVGPEAVLKGVFERVGAEHEYFKLEDIKLHEMSNNQVLATLRYDAKVKETGKTYNVQAAHLWTLKNGKVSAFQQYVDTKKLNEAMSK